MPDCELLGYRRTWRYRANQPYRWHTGTGVLSAERPHQHRVCNHEYECQPAAQSPVLQRLAHVYVDPDQWQTYITRDSPYYAGALRRPVRPEPPLPLDVRKIIARRSLLEFPRGAICNLGFGISQLIGRVAWEEGITDQLVLTVEQGIFGGVPVAGNEGGAGFNYQAMIDQPYMFDFYDGGGLDIASLSFAEVDGEGNVNVHAFEGRVRGPGGFPNISARTPRINFVGTLTAQGLRLDIDGGVRVVKEGALHKFVNVYRNDDDIRYLDALEKLLGRCHDDESLGHFHRDVIDAEVGKKLCRVVILMAVPGPVPPDSDFGEPLAAENEIALPSGARLRFGKLGLEGDLELNERAGGNRLGDLQAMVRVDQREDGRRA